LKNLVCMTDQKKICKYCVDYGEHATHDVRYIKDVQMLADSRRKKLENVVGEINTESRSRENLFRAENESLMNIIKGRFVRVRVELEKQEQEILKKTGQYLKEIKEKSENSCSSMKMLKIKEKLDDKISALKDAKFDKKYFEALKEGEIKFLPPVQKDSIIIKEFLKDFKESLGEELDEMNTNMITKLKEYSDISFNPLALDEVEGEELEEIEEEDHNVKREEGMGVESSNEPTEKYESDSSSEDEFEEEEENKVTSMNRESSSLHRFFPEFGYYGYIQHGQDLRLVADRTHNAHNQRSMTQSNNILQISGFRPIRSKRALDELPGWSYSQGNDGGEHEVITKRLFLRQGGEEVYENRSADFSEYFTPRVNLNLFSEYRNNRGDASN